MDFTLYTLFAAAAIFLLLAVWIIRLEFMLYKLLRGKDGSLDEAIGTMRKQIEELKKHAAASDERFARAEAKLAKAVSGNETVRFNPFRGDGSGGNQSFATALVNENGDGVVISSLYSRDRVSVFAKPIKRFSSEYELSGEEKAALQKAKESIG